MERKTTSKEEKDVHIDIRKERRKGFLNHSTIYWHLHRSLDPCLCVSKHRTLQEYEVLSKGLRVLRFKKIKESSTKTFRLFIFKIMIALFSKKRKTEGEKETTETLGFTFVSRNQNLSFKEMAKQSTGLSLFFRNPKL